MVYLSTLVSTTLLTKETSPVTFRLRVLLAAAAICSLIPTLFIPEPAPVTAQSQLDARQVRVPILMYHYVRTNPIARDLVGADLSVEPQSFAREMLMLSKAGMHTITFDDLYAALTQGHELPSHPVILTFDDGYEDFYTAAFPVLQALQMKATSFIITGKAGWKGYMTWDQMREIDRSGLVQFEFAYCKSRRTQRNQPQQSRAGANRQQERARDRVGQARQISGLSIRPLQRNSC